jgi:hypothetical protein
MELMTWRAAEFCPFIHICFYCVRDRPTTLKKKRTQAATEMWSRLLHYLALIF